MNFDKILINPPYSNGLGGKITNYVRRVNYEQGTDYETI